MDAASSFGPRWVASDRSRAMFELAIAVGLLEAELWNWRAGAPAWFNIAVYALLIATMVLSVRRRQAVEIHASEPTEGAVSAWVEALLTCTVLSSILLVAASLVGDKNETFEFVFLQKPPLKLLTWLLGKFAAALAQQLALQWFLWPVCREITRSRSLGMILAASIFGLIHLPSITLVAITLIGGLVWIGLYQRSGRLAPLIASHMVLATLAHGGLPERLTYDMRVGSTAVADQGRFTALEDPKARQINRRLKEHRDELRHFTALAYYQAQGGTDSDFIRGLFRDILGRPATDSDVAFWQDQHFPQIRQQIPSIFLASDEFAQIEARRQADRQATSTRR